MNRKEEMFIIAMEECGELIQACSKMIRSGRKKSESQYLQNLQDEIGDVMTMIEIFKMNGLITDEQIQQRIKVKKDKLTQWSSLFRKDDHNKEHKE